MKKKHVLFISLMLCFSIILQAQITWESAKRISWRSGYIHSPSITAFWKFVHIIWMEGQNGLYHIYFKRSTDYGVTWSAPKRMTLNNIYGYSNALAMAVEGPNIHLVYEDTGDVVYRRSADNGKTWSRQRLTWGGMLPDFMDIAVHNNAIHVAFSVWGIDYYPDVFYKRSTDNGLTWENTQRITWNQGYSDKVNLTVSGDTVHLTFLDDSLHFGHYDLFYRRSTDSGVTWDTRRQIDSPKIDEGRDGYDGPYGVYSMSTASAGDNAYIFYDGYYLTWIFGRYSRDNGSSWSYPSNPVPTIDDVWDLAPRASAAFARKAYLVYVPTLNQGGNYVEDIHFISTSDLGRTWSSPERLTYLENVFNDPRIYYSPGSGYFHVIATNWIDSTTKDVLIYKRGKE